MYDVRAGEPFQRLTEAVDEIRARGLRCRLLFLEADTKTIINRYKETRRSHPLCGDGCSIEDAVARERVMLEPVRSRADLVLDTSTFSTAKLRSTLLTMLGGGGAGALHVTVLSFGFKNGLPPEADLVWDVRFLPNPYYVSELKGKTGLDEPVRAKLTPVVDFLLPQYRQEGRTELVVAVGCTGGRHRSVAVAHRLAAHIEALGYTVTESHRDMGR